MMSILNSTTTTLLLVEKLSKMNCTHFGQNIHKNNEKWRYLEIFINKKIRHLEKNSKSGNTLKDEALFTGTLQKSSTKPYDPMKQNLVQNEYLVHTIFALFLISKPLQNSKAKLTYMYGLCGCTWYELRIPTYLGNGYEIGYTIWNDPYQSVGHFLNSE